MDIFKNAEQLKKIPLLSGCKAQLKLLAFTSEALSFNPGEHLFKMNDVSDCVYVILEGEVDIIWDENPDAAVNIATVGKNNVLGEIGVILDRPRSSSVIAKTQVQTLKIPANRFLKLVTESPSAAIEVMRQLSSKFIEVNNIAIESKNELRKFQKH